MTEESEEEDEDPDVQAEQLAAREALLQEWAKKDWTVEYAWFNPPLKVQKSEFLVPFLSH